MSKELEALKNVGRTFISINSGIALDECDKYKIIETALKENEQYKAIEKEFGVDLATLSKALKDGYWIKDENGIYHIANSKGHYYRHQLYKNVQGWYIYSEDVYGYSRDIPLKSHGVIWALTKEELEK